jgi:hypothetical protein
VVREARSVGCEVLPHQGRHTQVPQKQSKVIF